MDEMPQILSDSRVLSWNTTAAVGLCTGPFGRTFTAPTDETIFPNENARGAARRALSLSCVQRQQRVRKSMTHAIAPRCVARRDTHELGSCFALGRCVDHP